MQTTKAWAYVLIIVMFDQLTKLYFLNTLSYGERIPVLPFFDFVLLFNTGAAFSFLANHDGWQRWFFVGIGFIAIAVISWLLRRHQHEPRFMWGLTLILGGAIGNVIDRLLWGHVVDFLLFFYGNWYYPAFNIADSAITIGAVLIIFDEILKWRSNRPLKS
jgi:signal peptidase II